MRIVKSSKSSIIRMGIIISSLTRPLKSFNIENRAEKILRRQKPIPSPPYPSTADLLKLSKEANPNFMENHYRKDENLNERLKYVFVSSHVRQVSPIDNILEKPLPHHRSTEDNFDYGFWEPDEVPIGRCHLKTALQFITAHSSEPETNSVESISTQYKLVPNDVENILEYYSVFQLMGGGSTSRISLSGGDVNKKKGDQ